MKKIKKIGGLVAIFLFNLYNTCFADIVMTQEDIKNHGSWRNIQVAEPKPINYILIGLLVLVVVICAVIIIRRIIKKKKEKSNDNK